MRVPPRPYNNAFAPPSSSLLPGGEGARRTEGEDYGDCSDDMASDGGSDVSVDAAIKGLVPSAPNPPPPDPFTAPSLGLPVQRGSPPLNSDLEEGEEEEEDSDEFVGSLVLDFRGSENSVASARDSRLSPGGSLGECRLLMPHLCEISGLVLETGCRPAPWVRVGFHTIVKCGLLIWIHT